MDHKAAFSCMVMSLNKRLLLHVNKFQMDDWYSLSLLGVRKRTMGE